MPQKFYLFGMKLYLKKSKDFACRLKKSLYNVDIREKKKERRIRK
jgi:hypothetical protein